MGYHVVALLLAILLPAALFVSRTVVRRQRSAMYQDVVQSLFPEDHLPQLDLVGAKYDAPPSPQAGVTNKRLKRQSASLYVAALIFVTLTFGGFELLTIPIASLVDTPAGAPGDWAIPIREAFFWTSGGGDLVGFRNTLAVVAVGFLGSYVAVARYLVRQALNYELDGLSFVRGMLLVLMGSVIAMVSYRALINGSDNIAHAIIPAKATTSAPKTDALTGKGNQTRLAGQPQTNAPAEPAPKGSVPPTVRPSPGSPTGVSTDCGEGGSCDTRAPAGWWLGAAFLLGYAPEAGLSWVSRRLRLTLQKNINLDLFNQVTVVPVEVIDGIDSEIAYRLDQLNIEDVQNLATANPIQLYIETPFGLFEVFDWVLQAQLCLVTGVTAFLALKRHGIRTVFDLERAVLADGVPDPYVQAVGEVLFEQVNPKFRAMLSPAGGPITADFIRHAVAVAGDDLHVHRLRTLWLRIQERSWPAAEHQGEWIYRRGALPGDPDYGLPRTAADAWLDIARFYGRAHAAAVKGQGAAETITAARDEAVAAVRRVLAADGGYRERLRVLWDPATGAAGPRDLGSLIDDPELRTLLSDP